MSEKKAIKLFYFAVPFLLLLSGACGVPQKQTTNALKGIFRSTKGVMDPLSCVCYNSGYLTVGGEEIAICFADDANIACEKVEVSGKYINSTPKYSKTNPCPQTEIRYFMVEKYHCQ